MAKPKKNSIEEVASRVELINRTFQGLPIPIPSPETIKDLQDLSDIPGFNMNFLIYGYGGPQRDPNVEFHFNIQDNPRRWDSYFADMVRKIRKDLGISQKELGEEMWKTKIYKGKGISNFIARIENGLTAIRLIDFVALVMAIRNLGYQVRYADFFGENTQRSTTNEVLLQEISALKQEIKLKDELIESYKTILKQQA